MDQISRPCAIAATVLILHVAITKLLARLAYEREERLHGCSEVVKYSHRAILWSGSPCQKTEIHTAGRSLAGIKNQFNLYGKTFETRFLGSPMIRTMDPKKHSEHPRAQR